MPGIISPDQQTGTAPETAIPSKEGPKPISQRAREMIDRIKVRLGNPKSNPDVILAEIAAIPNQEPSKAALERKPRVFNTLDKVRHKELAVLARLSGIKDLSGFNRFVEYLESTYSDRAESRYTYKDNLSLGEKEKIKGSWREKGFKADYFNAPYKGKITLNVYKDIPFDVKREDIAGIKALLETGIDPRPVLDVIRVNSDFRFGPRNYLNSSGFLGLLKDPNLPVIFTLAQKMSQVSHKGWELYGDYTEVDRLRELVRDKNVSVYSDEFFARADKVAMTLGKSVDVAALPLYHELINNPDKMNFIEASAEAGILPDANRLEFSVFDSLNQLERDDLLQPLTVLIRSGVKIDHQLFSVQEFYSTIRKPIQQQLNRDLAHFIKEPSIQCILQDQERQVFAGILREINNGNVPSQLVEELYPVRQSVAVLNDLIFQSVGRQQEKFPDNRKLTELKKMLESKETRDILTSSRFREFLEKLETNIILRPSDYFWAPEDLFNPPDYPISKRENILVQLFKTNNLSDVIGPDGIKEILNPPDRSLTSSHNGLRKYEHITRYYSTIQFLKENGISLNPDNFKNSNWISDFSRSRFLQPDALQAIPQERRSEWIRAFVNMPSALRQCIENDFRYKEGVLLMTDEGIKRITRLANLTYGNDFFVKKYQDYDEQTQQSFELYKVLSRYTGDVEGLFTKGRPNLELANLLIKEKWPQALLLVLGSHEVNSDMLQSFDEPTRYVLKIWLGLPSRIQTLPAYEPGFPYLNKDIIDRYKTMGDLMRFAKVDNLSGAVIDIVKRANNYSDFLENGIPSKIFIREVVKTVNPQILSLFLTEEVISQYNDFEKSVFRNWKVLPEDLKYEALKEASDFPTVTPEQAKKYRVAIDIIEKIRNSPSAEIKKLEKELIGQLWKLENPRQALDEIISIFEKNNLPPVGKVYRVFETIYDNPGISGISTLESNLSHLPNLSPVLRAATPRERREIIYKDLLSINVQSGNPRLRDYLEVLRDGENVIAKLETQGADALNGREQLQLGYFFDKMDMLYVSSLFGRTIESRRRARKIESHPITSYFSLEQRLQVLKRNFRVRQGQNLTNRVSEMFLRPLGFSNIEAALGAMAKSKIEADLRNRQFVQLDNEKIIVKTGDRFKGVNTVDLQKILEGGAIAREYLGASAGSDSTPYDSDTSLILEKDVSEGVTSAMSASMAKGYGDVIILVRDRGQFGSGINQLESFPSGSERHFGIRTGFASTEIDALLLPNANMDSGKLDDLFVAIAQNGVYIPVCNGNGKVIFTPEKFDEFRKVFDGVSEYSASPVTVKQVNENEVATRQALNQLVGEISVDRDKVIKLSTQIRHKLNDALAEVGVRLRGEFDTSIYGAELTDTGSTARGSNMPGDHDFDMSLQLDPNDSKRLMEIAGVVKQALKLQGDLSHQETDYYQISGKGSEIIEGETLDIDIGVSKRLDEGIFASSDAITQKLESIKINLGEAVYLDVLANIVLAKKILKQGHAYKKLEHGGMGGIGVENWILLHNGNILDAFQSFWQAAHDEDGNVVSYEMFVNRYKIFDAGLNIKFGKHDNFARILKPAGYTAMVKTISNFLNK